MSHLAKIELEIKDLKSLEKACARMGFQFMRDQKTHAWYGQFVGDSPLPEGMKLKTLANAIMLSGFRDAHTKLVLSRKGRTTGWCGITGDQVGSLRRSVKMEVFSNKHTPLRKQKWKPSKKAIQSRNGKHRRELNFEFK